MWSWTCERLQTEVIATVHCFKFWSRKFRAQRSIARFYTVRVSQKYPFSIVWCNLKVFKFFFFFFQSLFVHSVHVWILDETCGEYFTRIGISSKAWATGCSNVHWAIELIRDYTFILSTTTKIKYKNLITKFLCKYFTTNLNSFD